MPSTTLSTAIAVDEFGRGALECYRLVELNSAPEAFVEECPDFEMVADEVNFQAAGSAPGGTSYVLVSVDENWWFWRARVLCRRAAPGS